MEVHVIDLRFKFPRVSKLNFNMSGRLREVNFAIEWRLKGTPLKTCFYACCLRCGFSQPGSAERWVFNLPASDLRGGRRTR